VLRQQGSLKRASDYRLREQWLERRARLLERNLLAWLGLGILDVLAGYRERLGRIFVAYAVIVVAFAAIYLLLDIPKDPATTSVPSHVLNAFLVSLTAIHGRVFFK
jgi:hypothetical protein